MMKMEHISSSNANGPVVKKMQMGQESMERIGAEAD
jgi:hypothetical protein